MNCESEIDYWHQTIYIVAQANMESDSAKLKLAAKELIKLSHTGYYDDEDGAIMMRQVAEYLLKVAARP